MKPYQRLKSTSTSVKCLITLSASSQRWNAPKKRGRRHEQKLACHLALVWWLRRREYRHLRSYKGRSNLFQKSFSVYPYPWKLKLLSRRRENLRPSWWKLKEQWQLSLGRLSTLEKMGPKIMVSLLMSLFSPSLQRKVQMLRSSD